MTSRLRIRNRSAEWLTRKEIEVGRIVAAEYLSLDGVAEDPGPAGEYEHRGCVARPGHLRGVRRLLAAAPGRSLQRPDEQPAQVRRLDHASRTTRVEQHAARGRRRRGSSKP